MSQAPSRSSDIPAVVNHAAASFSVGDALQPFVERNCLAGAVLSVGDRRGPISLEAIGYTDVSTREAMHPDTMFWIASTTKMFLGAAVMTLVEEGRISLDDPVEQYLPVFKGMWVVAEEDESRKVLQKASRPFTLREALSHTAGLPPQSPMERTFDYLSYEDALLSYSMMPLLSEPGTRYRYQNIGLLIGGRIIELVTGMPFDAYLDRRFIKPLGLLDTTFWPSTEQLQRLAKVHKPGEGGVGLVPTTPFVLRYPLDDRRRSAMPGGGLFSTGRDLERFARMLLNGGEFEGRRLMSAASVATMTSRQTPTSIPEVYGIGCQPLEHGFGHGGMCSNTTVVDTRLGISMTYLVQHLGFPGDGLSSRETFLNVARQRYEARQA